jgi:branched-chain amino acid transport system substrate-binding protein
VAGVWGDAIQEALEARAFVVINQGCTRRGREMGMIFGARYRDCRMVLFASTMTLIMSLALVAISSGAEPARKQVKVGIITSKSGLTAAYSFDQLGGIHMALEEIDASPRYKGIKIIPVEVDDRSDQSELMNVMNKLISRDRVVAIVGPISSGSSYASYPLANSSRVPAIGTTAQAAGIADIGEYIFSQGGTQAELSGPEYIRLLKQKLGIKRVAVMTGSDLESETTSYQSVLNGLRDQGVEIVTTQNYVKDTVDFRPQLLAIKKFNPDAVLITSEVQGGLRILRQKTEMGLQMPFVGGPQCNTTNFIRDVGQNGVGFYMTTMWNDASLVPRSVEFSNNYLKIYGRKPSQFSANSYDGVYFLAEALLRAKDPTSREDVRNALASIKTLSGVLGEIHYSNRHAVHGPILQMISQKGVIKTVK